MKWKVNLVLIDALLFKKELIGLFSNILPNNKDYIKTRNYYRIYLSVYLILFLLYSYLK